MLVVCSLSVFLSMCLFVLCVLCLTVLVNCLLNAFAICVGEVSVFSLKVMVLFWAVLVFCWLVCVLSSKEYVCCVCDPSVCLGGPPICQICVVCAWCCCYVLCGCMNGASLKSGLYCRCCICVHFK